MSETREFRRTETRGGDSETEPSHSAPRATLIIIILLLYLSSLFLPPSVPPPNLLPVLVVIIVVVSSSPLSPHAVRPARAPQAE
ncbi:unnamed protein product [Lampetra fluviatilis]